MTPRQGGISATVIALVAIAVVIVAAIGVLVATNRVNSGNPTIETSNCCADANLNLSTPCSTILTPNYSPVQRLQHLIETDPNFIAAEAGHNYVANGGLTCGFAINPGEYNGTTVDFGFTYTSNGLYTNNCGNTWNFTYYLTVRVPLTETGYDMSAIQIIPNNSSQITVTCTSST